MSVSAWITQVLAVVVALAAAPLFLGWVNQCRAWLQNRSAPRLLQPYRGIRKLFHKEAVIAADASPLFRVAPYIVFGAMVLAAAIIPTLGTRLPATRAADAIALVGLLATARVFLALAAMDVGTAFGTLGARREMMVGFLAEPALLMVIFVASLISATTRAAGDHRAAGDAGADALAEPGLHRRRLHDGAARRERAHPGRQPLDAPRADDDPRGDAAGVFGAAPGADGMGGGAEAVQLRLHRLRAVRALGRVVGRGRAAALLGRCRCWREAARRGAGLALIETVSAKLRVFRAPEFLATAFLFAVLGLLVHLLLGA